MSNENRHPQIDAVARPEYAMEGKLSEGGMGTIYTIFDQRLHRKLAMKVSKTPIGDAEAADARFGAEAKITAQLDHPGIVPVYELGVYAGDRAYFTMPLVQGKNASAIIKLSRSGEEGWNRTRAIGMVIKACQAVAYAHSKGIVHRDLKPANIMVGRFGEVYVLDWGLARIRGDAELPSPSPNPPGSESPLSTTRIESDVSFATEAGTVLGTPAYMPPEQAQGKLAEIDERSDVYSLGAMLYELLTGQPPYVPVGAQISPAAVISRVAETSPRSILDVDATSPPELVAVCEKAMARDKSLRYESSFELAEDLQAYIDHRVVSAYRSSGWTSLKKWCFRHRQILKVAALVLFVAVGVMFTSFWILRNRQAEHWIEAGQIALDEYLVLEGQIPEMRRRWKDARIRQLSWYPVWERQEELRNYRRLDEMQGQLDAKYNAALLDFSRAMETALSRELQSVASRGMEELYLKRFRELENGVEITLSPEYYKARLEALDPVKYRGRLDRPQTISLRSEPAGARVFCFRYELNDEQRLVPLPFDPRTGNSIEVRFLRVEKIWSAESKRGALQAADRLIEVDGKPVSSRRDLAQQIAGLDAGSSVAAIIERDGHRQEISWIPFPAGQEMQHKPGKLLSIHKQLGLDFESQPLDFVEECYLGMTGGDRTLPVVLPRGSYLFVFRLGGYHELRFPLVVPWRNTVEVVRLLREEQVPKGFVQIPGGWFSFGGDAISFQSLDRGEEEVSDFFMARHEVTVADYLEFLNDPLVRARMIPDEKLNIKLGDILPLEPNVIAALGKEQALRVVPSKSTGTLLFRHDEAKGWFVKSRSIQPGSPVPSVSQLAAREYAFWLSSKRPWKFRLPTDLEWEKAARGVDRRIFVWGNYLVWTFCWSAKGLGAKKFPNVVGAFPRDESVYGVRDLAGSLDEHTSSSSSLSKGTTSRRGGNWSYQDPQCHRVANRNGRLTTGIASETGFRLVAELPAR